MFFLPLDMLMRLLNGESDNILEYLDDLTYKHLYFPRFKPKQDIQS
jgi:hypothetical protein